MLDVASSGTVALRGNWLGDEGGRPRSPFGLPRRPSDRRGKTGNYNCRHRQE